MVPVVQPKELLAAYRADSSAADQQYAGKVLRVSGNVADVGRDASGTATVFFLVEAATGNGVLAAFANPRQLSAVVARQHVTMTCFFDGYTAGDVWLKSCSFP